MGKRGLADTYRRRLHGAAQDHFGFVTTEMAAELGVPGVELRKLAARGGLTNVAYGVYRFDDVPVGDLDQFMEAVLQVGPDAFLTGETVLAMHDLALVNPTKVRVGVQKRVRAKLPPHIDLVRMTVPEEDLVEYEGIPSTTVERALRDCIGRVMPDRLLEAVERARIEGLLLGPRADRLRAEIGGTR